MVSVLYLARAVREAHFGARLKSVHTKGTSTNTSSHFGVQPQVIPSITDRLRRYDDRDCIVVYQCLHDQYDVLFFLF